MKKILFSIFTLCLLVGCSNKEKEDLNPILINLTESHFYFERIYNSPLKYDEQTGEVISNDFKSYNDYESKVRSTYSKEISDKLLNRHTAPYYNKKDKLYVDVGNIGFAGIYTGYKSVDIIIKQSNKDRVDFEARVLAYIDNMETTSLIVFDLVAIKENDVWVLSEGVDNIIKRDDNIKETRKIISEIILDGKSHNIVYNYSWDELGGYLEAFFDGKAIYIDRMTKLHTNIYSVGQFDYKYKNDLIFVDEYVVNNKKDTLVLVLNVVSQEYINYVAIINSKGEVLKGIEIYIDEVVEVKDNIIKVSSPYDTYQYIINNYDVKVQG